MYNLIGLGDDSNWESCLAAVPGMISTGGWSRLLVPLTFSAGCSNLIEVQCSQLLNCASRFSIVMLSPRRTTEILCNGQMEVMLLSIKLRRTGQNSPVQIH